MVMMTSGSAFVRRCSRCRPEILLHLILAIFGLSHLQRTNVSHMLKAMWYVTMCVGIATAGGSSRGPSYNNNKYCNRNGDCRTDLREICYKLYEGCSQGACMCSPGTHVRDKQHRCRIARRGREKCRTGDKCPDGMLCHYGTCQCYVGEMTVDGDFCLRSTEKLLGESCSRSQDKCFQKSSSGGYTADEVTCSDLGVCECAPGLRPHGTSCRRHTIGEYGCVENHHCDGGSVCINRYCMCPAGREPMAGNTKCGRSGALHGLPVSATCDEIGERRYCDQGLVCHPCGDDGMAICVRSRLPPYQSPLYARQGTPSLNPSHTCLLGALVLAYIMLMR